MLDECKGDRFEDLLSSFSTLVLESCVERQRMKLKMQIADASLNHAIPLILAYRTSLQASLSQRHQLVGAAQDHASHVADELARLESRRMAVLSGPDSTPTQEVRSAVDLFRSSFVGDPRWISFLLEASPEDHTTSNSQKLSAGRLGCEDSSVIIAIDTCLQRHNLELEGWQNFLTSQPPQETDRSMHASPHSNQEPLLIFNEHTAIKPDAGLRQGKTPEPHPGLLEPAYAQLWRDLEAEIQPETKPSRLYRFSTVETSQFAYKSELYVEANRSYTSKPDGPTSTHHPDPDHGRLPDVQSEEHNQVDVGLTETNPSPHKMVPKTAEKSVDTVNQSAPADSSSCLAPISNIPSAGHSSHGSIPGPGRRTSPLSLLERARQSMSLAALAVSKRKGQTKKLQTRTSHFPINQFETPERTRYLETPSSVESGDSTPRERIFSADADPASVFKTRNRIALSPTIAPDRNALEDISPQHQLDGLAINDHGG